MTTPARAGRRKLLHDRFTELLTEWGSPHADHRAAALLDAVDAAGFTLPPAIDDPPPLAGRGADPGHRAACMDQIRDALTGTGRRDTP